MATHDKFIFLSATRILRHFFVSYLESHHFSVMFAIDSATIRQSDAQLRPKQPQTETMTPLASSAPSTSAPSSLAGGVTLEAIMAQPVHMDARLDTLSDELCQVNTRVGHTARRQAVMGGFTTSSSPSLLAFEGESDDGSGSDNDAEDEDASSSNNNEMTT